MKLNLPALSLGILGILALGLGFLMLYSGPTAGADFEQHRIHTLGLMIAGFIGLFAAARFLDRPVASDDAR